MIVQVNNKDYPVYPITDALGFLPYWVHNFDSNEDIDDLVEHMTFEYGFGKLHPMEGSTIKDGVWISPHKEDNDVPFMALQHTRAGTVYYYPWGVIALPTADGYLITRMD